MCNTTCACDRNRAWYDRLGVIHTHLGRLHSDHGHDPRFGNEIGDLGSAVYRLYVDIEKGECTDEQAEKRAADINQRAADLATRIGVTWTPPEED